MHVSQEATVSGLPTDAPIHCALGHLLRLASGDVFHAEPKPCTKKTTPSLLWECSNHSRGRRCGSEFRLSGTTPNLIYCCTSCAAVVCASCAAKTKSATLACPLRHQHDAAQTTSAPVEIVSAPQMQFRFVSAEAAPVQCSKCNVNQIFQVSDDTTSPARWVCNKGYCAQQYCTSCVHYAVSNEKMSPYN